MKTRYIIFAIIFLLFTSHSIFAQQNGKTSKKSFTVVIDAGHGGHDPGALGKIVQEKKLNLDVTLMLGKMISAGYPDVKVVYTRSTDVFLSLQERANLVNKNDADLFICIHTNASKSPSPHGAETFVLGIDKMSGNLDVAMRENAVMLLEDNYETTYQGFDPNSIDSYIMFELMQDQYMDQSLQYATLVQQEFSLLKRSDRGVRQAGFWVLHKSACPSVLVEMGFISNPEEEKFLASEEGKQSIAAAIYNAFITYKTAYDKKKGLVSTMPARVSAAGADKVGQQVKDTTKLTQKPKELVKEPLPVKLVKDSVKASVEDGKDSVAANQSGSSESVKEKDVVTENVATKKSQNIVFKVQIFAAGRVVKEGDPAFHGLKGCKYTIAGKYYKYTYGEETDYKKILDLHKQLKTNFPDCFIVAFRDGVQMSVQEAVELTKK